MRIHRILLRNFRGVRCCEVTFPLQGVTIVEGDNEVGKTSLAEGLDLLLDLPDSSGHKRVKAVQPVGRDEGPEVEVELSTGPYHLVYAKRWCRQKQTTLQILAPQRAQLTGKEAHDRVEAILAETLDRPLFDALRVAQGDAGGRPVLQVASLTRALDAAAGGDRAGDREDDLWQRICEERSRYVTATGRPSVERARLADQLAAATTRVAAVEARLGELEAAVEEHDRLTAEAAALEASAAEQARAEAELRARAVEVDEQQVAVRQLTAEHDAAEHGSAHAAEARARRAEQVDAVAAAAARLAEQEATVARAEPERSATRARFEATVTRAAEARAAFDTADSAQRLADADSTFRRQEIELEQLTERHDRVTVAHKLLAEAEAHLDDSRVDNALVAEIEAASLAVATAAAAASSGAAQLHTTALAGVSLEIDGRAVVLAAGEVHHLDVASTVELVLPGVARVAVRAGQGSRELAERKAEAERTLAHLCERAGVTSATHARAAVTARAEAERVKAEALATIERDLRDLTVDTLAQKIDRLCSQLTAYAASRAAMPPLPADLDAAQALARSTAAATDDARDALRRAEADQASAAADLRDLDVDGAAQGERLTQARDALEQATAVLHAARAERSDHDLEQAHAVAAARRAEVSERLAAANEALRAHEPEQLHLLLTIATEAKQRSADALHANVSRRAELRILLDVRGEAGLAQELDDARTRWEHLAREHERTEARAAAAVLLHDTFAARRAESHQRYLAPFRERLEQLGRVVFGPSFEVELDDDLTVARRTLDGTTVDYEQLSGGAKEQLGILSRLACATLVSADGGAPVVIDDALGWTDPRRVQRVGAAIATAGRSSQIIVLTCTPGRYAAVGGAQVVRLPNTPPAA